MNTQEQFKELENQMYELANDKKIFALINEYRPLFSYVADSIKKEIECNNFTIVYHPHVESKNQKIIGAEALFRLNTTIDGVQTEIKPYALFMLANYFNFEKDISIAAFDRACKDTLFFKKYVDNNFITSFNINPTLFSEQLCTELAEIADKNKLPRKNIAIELVEESGLEHTSPQTMNYFKKHGFRLYLDDFGTGYSTIDKLDLPFNVIKFGGQIIENIDQNPEHMQLVKDAMKICKQKKYITIAEHVETQAELETIKELGIDAVQGYIFGRIMTAQELANKYQSLREKQL